MTNTIETYQDYITSEHSDKPNFMAMIALGVSPMVQVQSLLTSMIAIFDIDNPPVGYQLDIIGQWAGVSRNLQFPITGVLFSWDGTAAVGWDMGVWPNPANPDSITTLDDATYLILVKAKIAANQWDGTTEGAYAIWAILFPNYNLLIQDNQNMSFVVAISGAVLDSLTLALLTQGYLPLRPEGVQISYFVVTTTASPLFFWDTEETAAMGWDEGSWGVFVTP